MTSVVQQENKYSNFIATVHYGGPNQLDLGDLQPSLDTIKAKCVFWIIGKEVCPSTGQKHLQCYFEFHVRQRRSALVRILPTFWAAANGTADENIAYCSKEGEFHRNGIPRNTVAARSSAQASGGDSNAERWKRARQVIMYEEDLVTLDDQIFVQHYNAVKAIRKDHMRRPNDLHWVCGQTPNVWLYGKSGCGKSRKAREDFPDAYNKMCNKWWDGYQGEKVIIIDDFDKAHSVLGHHIKIWADRYCFVSEDKGGAMTIRPQVVVVTSNWSPQEIWQDEQTLEPILRRFKVINMSPLDGAFIPQMAELIQPDPIPQTSEPCGAPTNFSSPSGSNDVLVEPEDVGEPTDLTQEL